MRVRVIFETEIAEGEKSFFKKRLEAMGFKWVRIDEITEWHERKRDCPFEKKVQPEWLSQALNEGDGSYVP